MCGTGAGYARAAGLRMIRGHFFEEEDFHHPNTLAVINEMAAHAYFAGEDPLGKQIIGGPQHQSKTVIGIVSDSKNTGLDASPAPQAFVNDRTWTEFAAIAFLMAVIGVYGVLAFAVTERIQEIGIRMALGAQRHQMMSLVFGKGPRSSPSEC